MIKQFQIGNFQLQIEYPDIFPIPKNFLLFEINDNAVGIETELNAVYNYRIVLTDHLPETNRPAIAARDGFTVYEEDGLETRYLGVAGNRDYYYACTVEKSSNETDIYYLSSELQMAAYDTIFCSLLSLERRMITRGGLILHCAYMTYQGEAILFSAPSETGKSTQAELWRKYRGSTVINGDRSLLQRHEDGKWYANGWPVCGSSEICHNEAAPIRAIVMLSQAKENKVRPLRGMEAFRLLYAQITINGWNTEAQTQAMDLLEDLLGQVEIYHLACDISEDAVCQLGTVLYRHSFCNK